MPYYLYSIIKLFGVINIYLIGTILPQYGHRLVSIELRAPYVLCTFPITARDGQWIDLLPWGCCVILIAVTVPGALATIEGEDLAVTQEHPHLLEVAGLVLLVGGVAELWLLAQFHSGSPHKGLDDYLRRGLLVAQSVDEIAYKQQKE